MNNRRKFLQQSGIVALGGLVLSRCGTTSAIPGNANNQNRTGARPGTLSFEISLAEFSFAGS